MRDLVSDIRLDEFRSQVETQTTADQCPTAIAIEKNIPIYDGHKVTNAVAEEWAAVIGQGAGVFVVKRAFTDPGAIDAASDAFRAIIAHERAAGIAAGDHFAKAGANDRIWNSLQKLCLHDPAVYVRYMANPVIDIACRAWLGPGYQIATQVNQVRPGGKAQAPHRDYHLGFMTPEQMAEYPDHIHATGPTLILQGGVAHCDMPVESGTTKLLPHSQRYLQGYIAATRPEFRDYFEENCVQLPLEKGDAIFFSPALFHAAGENRTSDVVRMVNLIQTASAFARHMEAIDRTAMSRAIFPYLGALSAQQRQAVIAATADGYPFPTNLDTDPPIGGLAPESQQDLLARAVAEGWDQARLNAALDAQDAKRRP
ncbi:phytanoyl-CoA dioxygenase family protein [Paracoccus sp. (in: a-proteobacteria)]|uniref:phytanoyl-CoA dioxygenase family protein n=1 Tax=Paracoccus sp. TaxID=267 RepID=UPI002AFE8770|nr:phytanoyl-CoA dioxygenase family protein [Paracoccus sp. (in: a-proteobacteria)]